VLEGLNLSLENFYPKVFLFTQAMGKVYNPNIKKNCSHLFPTASAIAGGLIQV
jgi:hypothetical protein